MLMISLVCLMIGGVEVSDHPVLRMGYQDHQPFVFEAASIGLDKDGVEQFLQVDAAGYYNRMVAAALADGIRIQLNYGFRSHEEQWRLYRQNHRVAAKPGASPHEEGVAVDINNSSRRDPAYRWLHRNAARFGFESTIRSEAWHWQWRGIPADLS